MNQYKHKITRISVSSLLIIMMIFSSITAALAWSDFTQSKTNAFRGKVGKASVVLYKYDKENTNVPIFDAHFELFMLNTDGTERQIGGTHATGVDGKIIIYGLSTGDYKFVETSPSYGYEYDKDDKGKDITEYSFEIDENDTLGEAIVEVFAYNVKKKGTFEIIKTVSGVNGASFEMSLPTGEENADPEEQTGVPDTEDESEFEIEIEDNEQASEEEFSAAESPEESVSPPVQSPASGEDHSFEFTVMFSSVKQDYKYKIVPGDDTLRSLEGNILHLKHGEKAVFEDVPVGVVYKVVEKYYPEYTTSSTGSQGTIKDDEVLKAEFTNTHGAPSNEVTELIIRKKVEVQNGGVLPESEEDKAFNFSFVLNGVEPTRFSLNKENDYEHIILINSTDTYSIVEDDYFNEGYYISSVSHATGTGGGTEIIVEFTNVYFGTEWINISGTKTWALGGVNDSVIPASIVVNLINEDLDKIVETKIVTPNTDGEWKYSFIAKKLDDAGREIDYRVEEIVPDGFEPTYIETGAGYDIFNTYTGIKDISVRKIWEHGKNETPPAEVKVQLYKDERAEGEKVVLNAANEWMYTWENLPADSKYTVVEEDVDVPSGYYRHPTSGSEANGFIIKNSFVDSNEELKISGSKKWIHKDNPRDKWPESVKIIIKKDDKEVASAVIGEKEHWTYEFLLPMFEDGRQIIYTVDEEAVPGYTKSINGSNITNTYANGDNIVIAGEKTWKHNDNPVASQPKSITVLVMVGDKVIEKKEVTAEDGWKYSFTMPKYEEDGKTEIKYKINEANLKGYKGQVDGYDLVNTFEGKNYPGDDPSGKLVKTGDSSNLLLWIMLIIIGLLGIGIVYKVRKGSQDNSNGYEPKH